ncbi:AGE family epimerase/isomerase [Lachnotalea glycerini]|nr:AGE family epimerase/isomerase [Lachnotalea glycerini]
MLIGEIKEYLTNRMIPFWVHMKDEEHGGFYGQMDGDLTLQKEADKGGILNSRILWFFANTYGELGDEHLLECATHAYRFLKEAFWDKEYGGVYWSVHYNGIQADTTKHTYCQAFAIYALSSYYAVSKDEKALEMAEKLFDLIEDNCTDSYGYMEAFDRRFMPVDNEKLSENGVMADKTMNTILHVFEAYTELYRVRKEENKSIEFTNKVAHRLRFILNVIADRIYNPILKRQEVFFDKKYRSILDLNSYGHDIEAAWLIDRGCEVLGERSYSQRMINITTSLTEKIFETAFTGDSLYNECCNGEIDKTRIWWVQAEAVIGFLNGYQKDKKEKKYYEAATSIWNYIKKNFIDDRKGSEWFWSVDDQGISNKEKGIVNMWKCPYHNGRMCLEVMRRLKG